MGPYGERGRRSPPAAFAVEFCPTGERRGGVRVPRAGVWEGHGGRVGDRAFAARSGGGVYLREVLCVNFERVRVCAWWFLVPFDGFVSVARLMFSFGTVCIDGGSGSQCT